MVVFKVVNIELGITMHPWEVLSREGKLKLEKNEGKIVSYKSDKLWEDRYILTSDGKLGIGYREPMDSSTHIYFLDDSIYKVEYNKNTKINKKDQYRYEYNGPVYDNYGKYIENWSGRTTAVSIGKAKTNFLFQYKKATNRSVSSKISLKEENIKVVS